MDTINIHDAKTHLSRLLGRVALGTSFVIAKAGRPVAKLGPLATEETAPTRRLGFLTDVIAVPDDFDTMGAGEIAAMFAGHHDAAG